MLSLLARSIGTLLLSFIATNVAVGATSPAPLPDQLNDGEITLNLGGVGGVYLLAEPGELIIDVQKQDLNRSTRETSLRAILVAPDRSIVAEQIIPDDHLARGVKGPTQRIRFSTKVLHKGIYALNITVSNDRYGTAMRWGFRTNCAQYVIETSRGHRDSAHEEPIVVDSPEHAGDLYFLPRPSAFGVELTDLPASLRQVSVFDADDALVETIPVDSQRQAVGKFPGDSSRGDRPWRLHLDAYQATVHIDGVTRWDRGDEYRNQGYWTPRRDAWFPLAPFRWLVTPYQQTVYHNAEQHGKQTFRIHNNSPEPQTILLELLFPERPWSATVSHDHVRLKPKASAEVTVSFPSPSEDAAQRVYLRATPANAPEFSTYASLTVRPGPSPASSALQMPITLKPYQHENQQFGYSADYPTDNQVYFDPQNRPYVLAGRRLWRRERGRWISSDLSKAGRVSAVGDGPIAVSSTKVAFDQDDDLYILGMRGSTAVLLHSADHGSRFTAYPIPGHENLARGFDLETFSGHNVPTGPPPIVRYARTASDPKLIWRRVHNLDLFLPEKVKGEILINDPIAISDQCIGFSAHSGIPSSVVSRGDKVHVAWGEATDPKQKVAGVPGYVVTYSRKTKKRSQPTLVGYGPPANDVHNTPSITMDGEGFLHLLIGTHGKPFPYARSLQPNDSAAGWTAAEPIADVRQTYVGLVSGQDGTLHAVYRMWRMGEQPHPDSHHAVLAYSRKPPGQPWSDPVPLVVSAFSEYSVFYHRLTIDHQDRLWLSYDYWSTFWFYRNDHVGSRRKLLTSPDGGETWELARDDHWND